MSWWPCSGSTFTSASPRTRGRKVSCSCHRGSRAQPQHTNGCPLMGRAGQQCHTSSGPRGQVWEGLTAQTPPGAPCPLPRLPLASVATAQCSVFCVPLSPLNFHSSRVTSYLVASGAHTFLPAMRLCHLLRDGNSHPQGEGGQQRVVFLISPPLASVLPEMASAVGLRTHPLLLACLAESVRLL